jgi:hypothetical protein
MTIVSYKTIKGSEKSAHQQVEVNDQIVGEVWREKARVIVSKLREPLRQDLRWRWFGKTAAGGNFVGRTGMGLAGPGYRNKDEATKALEAAFAKSTPPAE